MNKLSITHTINVKGGDLPDGFSVKIPVTFIYDGCPWEELVRRITSGQSDRVRTQTMLRKMSTTELTRLALEGYTIRWDEIGAPTVANPVDTIMAMTLADFMDTLVNDLGSTVENAIEIYAKKHIVDVKFVTNEYAKLIA